jgi:hypothetical protein
MANIVFNIAKGRVVEYYNRVKNNDPTNSALILVPLETTGLEADSVLIDKDDLAAVVAGATNEQTTMGRKTLSDAELAALPAPDDGADRYDVSLPTTTWTAVPAGNAISKICVCYDSDTTGGADSAIIPLTLFDAVVTPDGSDIQLTTGVFFRAS